uniref:NADH-ubiquinone oxidoreductase chain 2 n=1 Tax=Crossorhombus valderostratus TaxID=990577 RepID=A0A172E735_9PLEU|nr:NADH dehydrogenase subunit 2 [Crossorhombus valderostratus]AID59838.1 NADH dehydrogenase subunit 2 [Crossorhombus valderostratus]
MNPYILSALLMTLGLGTTLTFASSHWMLAWMGLEINTLAILPLMAQHHHPRAVEAATKYFLTQATAAAALLFASTTNAWMTGQWGISELSHPAALVIAVMALALKIGLAPVHSWLPEVLQGLDLNTGLILSTWQKLAPFALLTQLQSPVTSTPLLVMGILSTLIGGWGGLNQTQLRKVLAYSSIAHLGWMALVLQFMPSLTILTLFTYFAMTSSVFLLFKTSYSTTVNQLSLSWTKAPVLAAITPLMLLSLGGLPPLTGFMPKWLIMFEMTKNNLIMITTIAALTALLSLYFYLRLSYAMTLTMPPNNLVTTSSWRFSSCQLAFPLALFSGATLGLLPIMPGVTALLTP